MADSLEIDGSAKVVAPLSYDKGHKPVNTFLEEIDTLLEAKNALAYKETLEEELFDPIQGAELLTSCHFYPVEGDCSGQSEETLSFLAYGGEFGRCYLRSLLSYIVDLPDEDFKQAVYAYANDLTHGALHILQEITAVANKEVLVSEDALTTLLTQNENLLNCLNKIQESREKGGQIGIEESLLARKIHLQIFATATALEKRQKEVSKQ